MKTSNQNLITSTYNLHQENSKLNERIKFLSEEKERITADAELRFKNLATKILQENSATFKEQNESRLSEILNPFKENIEQFKKLISENYSNEARERFSLERRIKELIELNNNISKEAKELTLALKGNSKIQGNWGEMILESILEKSGLEKGREFSVQESTYNEDGKRLIADVVINYPDGRKIVIDSKVSLNAYTDLLNCEDQNLLETYKKKHILSIRNHINELKNKNYQDYLGDKKAEFIMMFIPNEAAYIYAMQIDHNLWQEAYDSRVLIISPTHLISVLRLVEQLWQHDRQTRNAIEIATESGKMYDKLVGFIEDLKLIEKSISSAHNAYDKAINKLYLGKGNLVSRAEKLKEMGAKASKSLPQ
ncbi:MAG: DNA recombination protein RmuC [Muribaculaceae bacterium]|nr:DNA recombination protein RmuC [Muribaculaceae bacterium]